MRRCTALLQTPGGTTKDFFDDLLCAKRCEAKAIYQTALGPRCFECGKKFVRSTLSGQNMLGIQLRMAKRMPSSIEAAERAWLRPIN